MKPAFHLSCQIYICNCDFTTVKSGRSQNSLENKCGTEMASKLGREQGTVPQERMNKRERGDASRERRAVSNIQEVMMVKQVHVHKFSLTFDRFCSVILELCKLAFVVK